MQNTKSVSWLNGNIIIISQAPSWAMQGAMRCIAGPFDIYKMIGHLQRSDNEDEKELFRQKVGTTGSIRGRSTRKWMSSFNMVKDKV